MDAQPSSRVVTFQEFARVLRERGRCASLAGQKRTAFALYRRADRCERIMRPEREAPWQDWPAEGGV